MCEDPCEHQVTTSTKGNSICSRTDQDATESNSNNKRDNIGHDLGCIIVDVHPLNPDGSWADGVGPQTYGPLAMPWYIAQSWGMSSHDQGYSINSLTDVCPSKLQDPWNSFWTESVYYDYYTEPW